MTTEAINATAEIIYTLVKNFLNVKAHVPPETASFRDRAGNKKDSWRVGIFNKETKNITSLGTGMKGIKTGLEYKPGTNEVVFYQLGMFLNGIVINKTFYNLQAVDFGKAITCTLEIKTKQVNDKRYTELSLTKTAGRWDKAFKIGAASPEAAHRFEIENSQDYINIVSLIP